MRRTFRKWLSRRLRTQPERENCGWSAGWEPDGSCSVRIPPSSEQDLLSGCCGLRCPWWSFPKRRKAVPGEPRPPRKCDGRGEGIKDQTEVGVKAGDVTMVLAVFTPREWGQNLKYFGTNHAYKDDPPLPPSLLKWGFLKALPPDTGGKPRHKAAACVVWKLLLPLCLRSSSLDSLKFHHNCPSTNLARARRRRFLFFFSKILSFMFFFLIRLQSRFHTHLWLSSPCSVFALTPSFPCLWPFCWGSGSNCRQ